ARVALHRVEVAVLVADADREAGDQVVEDEVVQDDDAAVPAERPDDPAVGVRVVADVVERDVRAPRQPPCAAADDLEVDPLAKGRHEQAAVVGDTRPLRRHGREVGDLHEPSRRSTTVSQVTCSASSLPCRAQARASWGCASSQAIASAIAAGSGAQTSPVFRSATISSGPPGSCVVTTGFSDRNASYGTKPKSSSTGA